MKYLAIILGVAIACSPMTATRFTPGIGVTDIFLAVAIITFSIGSIFQKFSRSQRKTSIDLVGFFWISTLPLLFYSTYLNTQYTWNEATLQVIPYFMVAVLIFGVQVAAKKSNVAQILLYSFATANLFIALIYGFWIATANANYFTDYRFIGLSENPNQVGLQSVASLVVSIILFKNSDFRNWKKSAAYIINLILTVYYGVASASDSYKLSVFLLVGLLTLNFFKQKLLQNPRMSLLAVLSTIFIGWYFAIEISEAMNSLLGNIEEAKSVGNQDTERFNLWNHGIEAGLEAPFFGNGAGAWSGFASPFGGVEAHNSIIDWFSITGGVGIVFLSILFFRFLFRFTWNNTVNYICLAALMLNSMFGFVLRHPTFWIALLACFLANRSVIAQQYPYKQSAVPREKLR
jgi:hypothetical protein